VTGWPKLDDRTEFSEPAARRPVHNRHCVETESTELPEAYAGARSELLELYRTAIEEYRFQVKLNADRSRDYFVANSAIVGAGVALLQAKHSHLAVVVFAVGFLVSLLAGLATHTQHGYYQHTRDNVGRLEGLLGFSDLSLIKTGASKSRVRRFASVTKVHYLILGLFCAVNSTAAILSSSERNNEPVSSASAAMTPTPPPKPRPAPPKKKTAQPTTVPLVPKPVPSISPIHRVP